MKFTRNTIALMLVLFSALSIKAQQSIVFQPEQPKPGQTIKVKFNTSATALFGVDKFDAYAFLLHDKYTPVIQELKLVREGTTYTGEIKLTDTTDAVFVRFSNPANVEENSVTAYTYLYGSDGNLLPGSALAVSKGYNWYAYPLGVKRDADLAKNLLRDEFSKNPSSKQTYDADYLGMLSQSKDAADKDLLKTELDKIVNDPKSTEAQLINAKIAYESGLKDKDKAAEIEKMYKERFPQGTWYKNSRWDEFYKEKDLAKKEEIFRNLMKDFPNPSQNEEQSLSYMAGDLTISYANKGDMNKMKEMASFIKSKSVLASTYNSIAWKLAGEGIEGKPGDIKTGKELSGKSLEIQKDLIGTYANKPSYSTEQQYKKQQEQTYHMYADTYATLLYHNKEYEKAYEIEKKAMEAFDRKDVSMNEAYSSLTEKIKGPKAAQQELEAFTKDGKSNANMKAQLKRIYLAQKHNEADWTTYIAALEKEPLERKRKELAKQMINMPAPQFTLKDLNGTEISLASLKGKTVVVDFWATWCGPCVASFPGMQMAVNKYKNDPNVVFVFIDTWESGPNREKLVTDFIAKNKYSFTVLYDQNKKESENEFIVVSDFKVDGIPTKFVIDGNSNIRFKSVGYGGSADMLVAELSMMIDMVAEAGRSGSTTEKRGF